MIGMCSLYMACFLGRSWWHMAKLVGGNPDDLSDEIRLTTDADLWLVIRFHSD